MSAFDNPKLASDIEQESEKTIFEIPKSFDKFQKVFNNFNEFQESETSLFQSQSELSESALYLLKDLKNVPLIFVEGITILNHPLTSSVCDLKFFLSLDHATCLQRRDLRSYDPPDVPGYFEQVVWPEYLHLWEDVQARHQNQVWIHRILACSYRWDLHTGQVWYSNSQTVFPLLTPFARAR